MNVNNKFLKGAILTTSVAALFALVAKEEQETDYELALTNSELEQELLS